MPPKARPSEGVAGPRTSCACGRVYDAHVSATIEDVRARALRLFRTEQSANAFLDLACTALGGVPAELAAHGHALEVLFYLECLEHVAPPGKPLDRVPGYRRQA